MNAKKLLINIMMCALALIGWISCLSNVFKNQTDYQKALELAEKWETMGLYGRAAGQYEHVVEMQGTRENWRKLLDVYAKLCQESPDDWEAYCEALQNAIAAYPQDLELYKSIVELYQESGQNENTYLWAKKAITAGVADEALIELAQQYRYAVTLKETEYEAFLPLSAGTYVVMRDGTWDNMDTSGYYKERKEYRYLNQVSEQGVQLCTSEHDSRLVNQDGMTLGIFSFSCDKAGIFSEGYIPIQKDGSYSYYDEFAEKAFGNYEEAGNFYEGTAAVKENGSWHIIDSEGNAKEETYADIVLDKEGNYNRQELILAAEKSGEYHIYDEKWKQVGDFTCEEIDSCTSDRWMAFRRGNLWGYVDGEGNVVIEPQYKEAKSFSNGLAAVQIDGKWGFINKENKVVIPCEYLDADYFNADGSCMVCTWTTSNLEEEQEEITYSYRLLVLNIGIQE